MLRHTLKSSLRILYREKLYTLINVVGLAVALSSCLILGLYLYSELTYDRHFANHERIFRVANVFQNYDDGDQRRESAMTSPALAQILANDFPEIEAYVRFSPQSDVMIRYGQNSAYWEQVFDADDNVFSVFSHDIIHGNPDTALVDPSSAAVSRSFAEFYFGDHNPLGETITLGNGETRNITLVFEDLPENTHLKYDVLFSLNGSTIAVDQLQRFLFGVNTYTYVLMPEGYEAADFDAVSATFFSRYMEEAARERTNRAWRGWLQPLAGIHLGQELLFDQPSGNRYYLYGFVAVVVFILLIASINYMNLATAGYSKRARGVGIRKILGAERMLLALQFLGEALILAAVSLILGIFIVELAINEAPLTQLMGKALTLNFTESPEVILVLAGVALLLGVLSGLYPALYLSSIRPLAAIGGDRKTKPGRLEFRLREFLLLLQFTVSIGVIACTALMVLQMRFVASQPLGFSKENRVVVTLRDADSFPQIPLMETALLRNPQVRGVTFSTDMLGEVDSNNSTAIETREGSMRSVQMAHMAIDDDFIDVMGMQLVAGRNFSPEVATDASSAVLVNRALVEFMEWDEPLGKSLRSTWGTDGSVIGVVEDFNFRSLHTDVAPFFLYQPEFSNPGRLGSDRQLVVSVSGERVNETLDFIERTVTAFTPGQPFEFRFLDSALDELYLSEYRLMALITVFASICIIITCLGLYGLATFTAEQRTKEVGIRKVLGAGRPDIVRLLLGKTLRLAGVGMVMAALIVYPVMNTWLDSFAYRIVVNPVVFLLATSVVVIVACGTMLLQLLRLAGIRPVQTLRYE